MLDRVAVSEFNDKFLAYDRENDKFYDWARARLAPSDRFLSNFHKPLQRRMLFSDPNQEMPPSKVVKLAATGEVYLVGQSRIDTDEDSQRVRLTVLHLVSNDASGHVNYFDYEVNDLNPEETQALLDKVDKGKQFIAVEYVSAKQAESSDEAYQGKYLGFTSWDTPFKKDGVFTVNGTSYKVVETYSDSGFSGAILLQQEDDMVALQYVGVGVGSGYDPTSGDTTINEEVFSFSGTVDSDFHESSGERGKRIRFNIFSKATNLPFTFSNGREIILPSGDRAVISQISRDNNAQGQIKLMCIGN